MCWRTFSNPFLLPLLRRQDELFQIIDGEPKLKIGANENKKVAMMAVLLVIATTLVVHSLQSFKPPSQAVNSSSAVVATRSSKETGRSRASQQTGDPELHNEAGQASYSGMKRNIFRMVEPVAKQVYHNDTAAGSGKTQTEVPHPPMISLRFYGYSIRPGEPTKAFLAEGEDFFVARESDIVNRRYRLLRITNNSVLVEDTLDNIKKTIPLTPAAG
jgi:hypothetical protein